MKLASRPLLTQSITTAVLFATGDTMAQQLVERKGFERHDIARTGRMALYGGGMNSTAFSFHGLTVLNSRVRTCCYDVVQVPAK